MYQINRLSPEWDVGDSSSDRRDERHAAVAQMMAENREGLGMKVIAVMVQRYGVLPKELWDLNSISDMGAGRGVTYTYKLPEVTLKSILSNDRYSIVNLVLVKGDHKVELPSTLRQLKIWLCAYDHPLDLPETLQELIFEESFTYSHPLVLPNSIRKLKLPDSYNIPVTLPAESELVELELGREYTRPLILPQRLKKLTFDQFTQWNYPLALPAGLLCLELGDLYSQPITLPSGLEEIRVGSGFTHDLSLPNSLRKIEWGCNRPIKIPEGVSEVYFRDAFNQPVILPPNLKKAAFVVFGYTHPVCLPTGLQELLWGPSDSDALVLPEGLQKLTWASEGKVSLPLGLKELILESNAPLVLPEGLLKITFGWCSYCRYKVPESVVEMTWQGLEDKDSFTHPFTLQHLILEEGHMYSTVDLSHLKVHKMTIRDRDIIVKEWPQGLKELAFAEDLNAIDCTLRVPKGCRLVGEKRPRNVIME